MIRKILKKLFSEKGQAVIELAVTLPILIMILCGIVDYGWIFTNQNIVDRCSREGARYAVIHATDSGAVTAITNYTRGLAPSNVAGSLVIGVTFSNTSNPGLGDVTVRVSNNVSVLTPIAGIFTSGQAINLNSSTRMKVE